MLRKNIRFDPEHWLSRAEEVRANAENLRDEHARATLLAIAEEYEHLAERARIRLKTEQSGSQE